MRKAVKNKKQARKVFKGLKYLIISTIAFMLASMAGLNLYLASLPPIQNLEEFKPNIVTQIYSQDGQIIKTFTAIYNRIVINCEPHTPIGSLIFQPL